MAVGTVLPYLSQKVMTNLKTAAFLTLKFFNGNIFNTLFYQTFLLEIQKICVKNISVRKLSKNSLNGTLISTAIPPVNSVSAQHGSPPQSLV